MQIVSRDAYEEKQRDGCDFLIASVIFFLLEHLKIVQKVLKKLKIVR